MNDAAFKTVVRARLMAQRDRERAQGQLLDNNDQFAETIRMKLTGLLESNQFVNFARCGNEQITRTCDYCGRWEEFPYRCNLKWCPRCQQRLTLIRRNLIQLWARKIKQPKHLVVTQRNFPTLTHKIFREHTRRLAKLRRTKCFEEVKGGCVSTEITNEGNGWHLHAHMLLDVRWLDMAEVSKTWGSLVGQNFAIVKIKDVSDKHYLQEICKYVVEGSELAKWEPDEINEFVQAIRGLRMFNSFGSLRTMAPEIKRELLAQKPDSPICECGHSDFIYRDDANQIYEDAKAFCASQPRRRSASAQRRAAKDAAAGDDGTPSML